MNKPIKQITPMATRPPRLKAIALGQLFILNGLDFLFFLVSVMPTIASWR
jgi:hypothetical protein